MKAHVIENGIVVNTILVESLDDRPNLIDASQGGSIGESWDGMAFTSPATVPTDPAIIESNRIADLWQGAHDYEFVAISGSAVGLVTIGVLQAKPKCLAVQNWIKSIWVEYYTRKAGTSTDNDYSVCGPCPHSVPELMAELGL